MRVTIEIEGPIGSGKTQLAQQIENKLREEYSIEFVSFKTKSMPPREIYRFNVAPL